jgi:hypothetical protein
MNNAGRNKATEIVAATGENKKKKSKRWKAGMEKTGDGIRTRLVFKEISKNSCFVILQ